ncbi:hypothetical protein QQP08_007381 [Theobroma cacao]|nr:hypothetical protein QQP08_007381 [Theobroma cacao]
MDLLKLCSLLLVYSLLELVLLLVVEAALNGVPLLACPKRMFGDQRIDVKVIEALGWGLCVKRWGWGEDVVLKGE